MTIQSEAAGKFFGAVKSLAVEPESLQERLKKAHRELMRIDEVSLPNELRSKFVTMRGQLESNQKTPLADQTARETAEAIFGVFEELVNWNPS